MKYPIAVLLHNVRSAHNVGSIFRTADAAGVERIVLTGYTPQPIDRFGRSQKEIAKTALGAEKTISWTHIEDSFQAIESFKKDGWTLVGVEQDSRAVDYREYTQSGPTVFIFGDEVRGVSKEILDRCDLIVEIPMRDAVVRQAHHPRHSGLGKESLNVSVAAGIVLFQTNSSR